MVILIKTLTDEAQKQRDYSDAFKIEIDGKEIFSVYDGEPEDNNLSRNFNDVYKIPKLLNKVYQAGLQGEVVSIVQEEVEEF